MNRKVFVLVLSAVAVLALLAWGRGSLTLATTKSAANEPPSQRAQVSEWEYCAVTGIDYLSDEGVNRRYRVTIVYSRDYGARPEQFNLEPTANPLFSTLRKLGNDGWELVGQQENAGFSGYSTNGIFFKRPQR